jgi:hypothetical protein
MLMAWTYLTKNYILSLDMLAVDSTTTGFPPAVQLKEKDYDGDQAFVLVRTPFRNSDAYGNDLSSQAAQAAFRGDGNPANDSPWLVATGTLSGVATLRLVTTSLTPALTAKMTLDGDAGSVVLCPMRSQRQSAVASWTRADRSGTGTIVIFDHTLAELQRISITTSQQIAWFLRLFVHNVRLIDSAVSHVTFGLWFLG